MAGTVALRRGAKAAGRWGGWADDPSWESPGTSFGWGLNALIDVPLSVSPVVVGLSLVLVYGGRDGWFGPGLEDAVKIVSGNLIGQTQTTTLVVEQKYQDFEQSTAYAAASVL